MAIDSFENNHLRAYWNPELQCVVLSAKGSVISDDVRTSVAIALESMRGHGTARVLADQTLLQVLASGRAASRHSTDITSTQRSAHLANEVSEYLQACGR